MAERGRGKEREGGGREGGKGFQDAWRKYASFELTDYRRYEWCRWHPPRKGEFPADTKSTPPSIAGRWQVNTVAGGPAFLPVLRIPPATTAKSPICSMMEDTIMDT
jgi:hypothetical protein